MNVCAEFSSNLKRSGVNVFPSSRQVRVFVCVRLRPHRLSIDDLVFVVSVCACVTCFYRWSTQVLQAVCTELGVTAEAVAPFLYNDTQIQLIN